MRPPWLPTLHNGHYQTFLRESLVDRARSGPGPIVSIHFLLNRLFLPVLACLVLSACGSVTSDCSAGTTGFAKSVRADLELPVASTPFDHVQANWKERLDQRYACLELRGSYTQ